MEVFTSPISTESHLCERGHLMNQMFSDFICRTHVITCSLTPTKLREFQNLKVVLPRWIVESVKQGKLLPWQDYRYLQGDRVENAQGIPAEQKTLFSFNVRGSTSITGGQGQFSIQAGDESSTASALNEDKPSMETRNESTKNIVPVPYAAESSNSIAQKALADPNWRRAHTSAAPDFIEGYYRNSRLHYLSTWKAELRALIAEAQERTEQAERTASIVAGRGASATAENVNAVLHNSFSMRGADIGVIRSPSKKLASVASEAKARDRDSDAFETMRKRKDDYMERVIMHCDFDCFFVSVGLITRPHLRGKPVVVCHSQGTQGGASSTSEVASASYEAREQGVRNGMRFVALPCEL